MIKSIIVLAAIWPPTNECSSWGLTIPAFTEKGIGANTVGDDYRELLDNLTDLVELCTDEDNLSGSDLHLLRDPKFMANPSEEINDCFWRYFVVQAHVEESLETNHILESDVYSNHVNQLISSGPGQLYFDAGEQLNALVKGILSDGKLGHYYCMYSHQWRPQSYYKHNLGNVVTPANTFSYEFLSEVANGNHYEVVFKSLRSIRNLKYYFDEYLSQYETIESLNKFDQWHHVRMFLIEHKNDVTEHLAHSSLVVEATELFMLTLTKKQAELSV